VVQNDQRRKYEHPIAGPVRPRQNQNAVVKWWTKPRHRAAVADVEAYVESSRSEVSDIAKQASERAAATIAAAVRDLKAEIEELFAQTRRSAGWETGPATAHDKASGSIETGAASVAGPLPQDGRPATEPGPPDLRAIDDRSAASLSADASGRPVQ